MAGRVKLSAADLQGGQFLDEPPAPSGRERLTDADLQGGQFLDQPQAAIPAAAPAQGEPRVNALGEKLTHGPLETFLRSASDVLTFGHHDEVSGWIEAAMQGHPFDGDAYRQARDRYRAEMKQGNEEHPVAHYAGMAAGVAGTALVPGLGAARGATLANAAVRGAALGALAGEGASEGDLTKGEFGKVALDTALGAGTGAVAGAAAQKLSNWISAAPARQEAKELAAIKEGVQYKTRIQKIEPIEKEMMAKLKAEPVIRKAIDRDAREAVPLVAQKVQKVADQLEPFYESMAEHGRDGVPFELVQNQLKAVQGQFRGVAKAPLAENVAGLIDKYRALASENGGKIPAQLLREDATTFQQLGFGNLNMFGPVPLVKQLKQQVGGAVREAISDHVESLAADTAAGKAAREAFVSANKDMSHWLRIQDVVTEKAQRLNQDAVPMGTAVKAIAGAAHAIRHPISTAVEAASSLGQPITRALATRPGQAVLAPALQGADQAAGRALVSSGGIARLRQAPVASDDREDEENLSPARKREVAMRLKALREGL